MNHYTFEKFIGASTLGLVLLLLAAPAVSAADTPAAPPSIKQELPDSFERQLKLSDAQDGTLMFRADSGKYTKAPMVQTDVHMDIAGPVIRTRLSQTFENTTDQWVEGVYVFPLPENAAVDHLRMVIGGRFIEGQIKEKQQAKKIYEQAKSEGKKASLVEQERPNIFTASVANIGPHEKIAIQIEYQDKASIKAGVFSTRFPMTVAPRYSPPMETVQIASATGEPVMAVLDPVLDRNRISPPLMNPVDEPIEYLRLPVTMTVNLDAGFPLEDVNSPYHKISVQKFDADSVRVSFPDGPVPANRDFKLEWQAQPAQKPYSAVFKQEIGSDTYLLSMLTPVKPKLETPKTHARESIFVVDTSGSMGGTSIEQARASLLLALEHLEEEDTFNIIRFSSDQSSLFRRPQIASEKNLAKAERFVRGLKAGGGTNMAPALSEALVGQNPDDERVRQIMFITDGAIGNEHMMFAILKDNLKNSRLFPVGIGSAPNSFFMSRAAKFGRGTYVQIGDIDEVEKRMGTLFAALDNPVLTNLKLNLPQAGESYPGLLPDLYEGDPLVTVTKLPTKDMPRKITIKGRLADASWQATQKVNDIPSATGLSVLWARKKIADLEEGRFDRKTAAEIDAGILETALEHHLVSRLTSLVAVDITPSRPMGEALSTQAVPTQLPAGWDFAKLAAASPQPNPQMAPLSPTEAKEKRQNLPLPATASPHVWLSLLGSLFLLGGALLLRRRNIVKHRA